MSLRHSRKDDTTRSRVMRHGRLRLFVFVAGLLVNDDKVLLTDSNERQPSFISVKVILMMNEKSEDK